MTPPEAITSRLVEADRQAALDEVRAQLERSAVIENPLDGTILDTGALEADWAERRS